MQSEGKNSVTRIWILRHGRSTLNNAQTFQGCGSESELTEEGMRSAQAAAARLTNEGIDTIYASPLKRAVQTAECVKAVLSKNKPGIRLGIAHPLREIELPGWEGLPYVTVRERYGDKYQLFRENPANFSLSHPKRGEVRPVLELQQRVLEFLSLLAHNEAGKRVLLVTHGGPASILLLAALRLPLQMFHSIQVMHAGLSCLSVQHYPARIMVEALNDVSHLNAGLPKLKNGKNGLRLLFVASDATHEEMLAQVLEPLPIHRALAADQDGVITAMRLLRDRRQSTVETCTAAGLSRALDHHLSSPRPDELSNLLIAGSGNLLATLLTQSMRWDGLQTPTSLESCLGLSVVHLPRATDQPVLQAMNTYWMGGRATGETA